MPHTGTRRPFTRRGPPTEEEERERLLKAREKADRALQTPAAPTRPPVDSAQPTINPPRGNGEAAAAGTTGAHDQVTARLIRERELARIGTPLQGVLLNPAELRAADQDARRIFAEEGLAQRLGENEQRRIERNQRLVAAGKEPEELPSERANRRAFIRAEAQRKAEEVRRTLGLPPTSDEKRESFRTRAARFALLDGDTEQIKQLQGSLEAASRKVQANPDLLEDGQIVRTTINGRETFQRFNRITRDFTPVTVDPITGEIAVDTSDKAALSELAVQESFNTRISALRELADDPNLTPEARQRAASIATGLEAIQESIPAIGQVEALRLGDLRYSQMAPFIKRKEEELTDIQKALKTRLHARPDGTEFILQPDGEIDRFTPKPEEAEAAPTNVAELVRTEKGQKVYLDTYKDMFVSMTKIAAEELKARNDAAKAKFDLDEKATGTFTPETPKAIDPALVHTRTRDALAGMFKPPDASTETIESFSDEAIIRGAKRKGIATVGRTMEEIKADLMGR